MKRKQNLSSSVEYCDFCGGVVKPEILRTLDYQRHGRTYTFENVEAEVCQSCGERYFHARTLDELNSLIEKELESVPPAA